MSVKFWAICQLSVRLGAICHLSVNDYLKILNGLNQSPSERRRSNQDRNGPRIEQKSFEKEINKIRLKNYNTLIVIRNLA